MFEEKKGKGYIGNSMSVNAHESYINNEMPLSKWTKTTIIDQVEYLIESKQVGFDLATLKRLTVDRLRQLVLSRSSWHHTGALFNATDFYSLKEAYILNTLTNDDIAEEIKRHKEQLEATKEQRAKEKAAQELRRNEKEFKAYIIDFQRVTTYKTANGLWKAFESGKVTEDELLKLKQAAIEKRRNELKPQWSKDPNATRRLENINNDDFIWSYVK